MSKEKRKDHSETRVSNLASGIHACGACHYGAAP